MFGFLSERATICVLLLFVFAGFVVFPSAAISQDLRNVRNWWEAVAIVMGGGALCLLPQYFAIRFAQKVWRQPSDWKLFGNRRLVWQILIPIAYSLGLVGGLFLAFDA